MGTTIFIVNLIIAPEYGQSKFHGVRRLLLIWVVLSGCLLSACSREVLAPSSQSTSTASAINTRENGLPVAATPVLNARAATEADQDLPTPPAASDTDALEPGACSVDKVAPSDYADPSTTSAMSAAGVAYDADTNTIRLHDMAPTTLAAVSRSLDRPDLLRETAPGEWLLSANLHIEEDATLLITAPEVQWLKLRSDEDDFVWIKALGGRLDFTGVCVSSWDASVQDVDENYEDGRSFVLARDGAHMEIRRSELRYLGYAADESYGLAWRRSGTTGLIVDSHLAYNYYGLYTYNVSGLVIRGNEVHHNVRYGIDPHTNSNRLLIEDNIAHHNGKHGIILAEECSDSIIRNNQSFHNGLHGIVLYQDSNDNLVEYNISYANGRQGININDASDNTLINNIAFNNHTAGIGVGQDAEENLILSNEIYNNQEDGIYLYSDSKENVLRGNIVHGHSRYGIYIKSDPNLIEGGNQVFQNRIGIYINTDNPPEISREENRIYDNREGDVEYHDD
jgi:parallel beta-helix repeat protein